MKFTNKDLITKDANHLLHPLHSSSMHENGHVWIKGQGALLYDADGKEFIDGLSGLWNVVAGHGRNELAEAAENQMRQLAYCSAYSGSSNAKAIELAERISEITYPEINRFFFTSGGGEASESSFKLSRSYWKLLGKPRKTKVISRQWGYHGVTLAAMSATGISNYWPAFEPRVPGFIQIPSPYPYRYSSSENSTQGIAAANELEKVLIKEDPETVAMFLAEPVQGAGGVIVPQDDYFPRIREICDKYNILFVADEVITGFGRTGQMFALNHWDTKPDVIQFAKAITSGYFPLGGIGISDEIADVIDSPGTPWMHAYTYSAHPVGCAVALKNLDIIQQENFPSQASKKGNQLLSKLKETLSSHPNVGNIRGKGLMCGVEFVEDKETKNKFPASHGIGNKISYRCQKHGLFSRASGDTFMIAPPIITSPEQIDNIIDILNQAVDEVFTL